MSVRCCFAGFLLIIMLLLPGCSVPDADEPGVYGSFRGIPGIAREDIDAIEQLRLSGRSFTFGMTLTTEAFYDSEGNVMGFASLFCEWMTDLFGIEFKPAIYEWNELMEGLESGFIDFTGEVTRPDRRNGFIFTADPILEHQLIVIQLKNGAMQDYDRTEPLRYAFLEGTAYESLVSAHTDRFEALFADDYAEAYEMLKSGAADAFIAEESVRAAFDRYDDTVISQFFPLVFVPAHLTTGNPELSPIISAVQNALDDTAIRHLVGMYKQGLQDYLKQRLYHLLTDDERQYIMDNPVVPFAAEVTNYPVSFYNSREGAWQGIAIDVLEEVGRLTGIEFEIVNSPGEEWSDLMRALETGRAAMVTELIYSAERAEKFIWPENSLFASQCVLISKTEHHDISVNEILYLTVGMVTGTGHAAMFEQWFPGHRHLKEYDHNTAAFEALERGDIDLMMSSSHLLLNLTNYREQAGYKANYVFPAMYESAFGFNRDYAVLRDIVDKALPLIDTEEISSHWMRRTFDYRIKLEQQRAVWIIAAAGAFFILASISILFLRKRSQGRRLENLVHLRTGELEEAIAAAETANRSKSSFLASMSHEIRTPMNAIIGMLELMTHEPLNERQMNYVKDMNHSATSLLTIINDILDMSKIESGKMELVPVDFNFLAFLDHMHSMFTYVAEEKGLEFRFEVAGNAPHYLYGDDVRLRQVIINICGNAVKFTEKGHVKLNVRVSGGSLVFEVSDTGRGIRQEDIGKLFSAFQQTDSKKNRGITGTGLGLAICKSFVEMMGGTIEIQSEYGAGTVFVITIPYTEGDAEKVKAADVPKGRKLFAPKAKILVVDDNEFNLRVAVGLLTLSGIAADTAQSGALAIEMVRKAEYNVVFMDHMMPEMDGVEATAAIRSLGGGFEKLVVVALTANAVAGAKEFFLANGFDDFVSKPIDVRELISVLEKWLPGDLLEKVPQAAGEPDGVDSEDGEDGKDGKDGDYNDGNNGAANKKHSKPSGSGRDGDACETDGRAAAGFLDAIRGIDEINVSVGLNNVGGSGEMYFEALGLCCRQLPSECDRMSAGLLRGDIGDFAISVHAIKSVLATIGAVGLSGVALSLETAAKSGDAASCEDAFPEFCDGLLALHKKLLPAFPVPGVAAEKPPGDVSALREGLDKALGAALEYDSDAGLAAIEPLLQFDFGDEINPLLEAAAKHLREFDCEKAAEILRHSSQP